MLKDEDDARLTNGDVKHFANIVKQLRKERDDARVTMAMLVHAAGGEITVDVDTMAKARSIELERLDNGHDYSITFRARVSP